MLLWSLEENSPLHHKEAVEILFSLGERAASPGIVFFFSSFCSQVTSNPPFLPPLPTQYHTQANRDPRGFGA